MKWILRTVGVDKFPDTTLIIVVHEASYQGTVAASRIRLTAGDHQAMTDADVRGRFQHPISMLVEQGTQKVLVDLTDAGGTSVLASVSLDVMTDIGIQRKFGFREQVFQMKQKNKAVANPRVKLTIRDDNLGDEEALFGNISLQTWENQVMFQETVAKNAAEDATLNKQIVSQNQAIDGSSRPTHHEQVAEITVLSASLRGPLELHGPWDRKRACYVAVLGPPEHRKHSICIWQDYQAYDVRRKPQEEIDLLKILSVQPDPAKPEVFFIIYMPKRNEKRRLAFERVDRSRDLWVELLSVLVDKVRKVKDTQRIQMGRTVAAMTGGGSSFDAFNSQATSSALSSPGLGRANTTFD